MTQMPSAIKTTDNGVVFASLSETIVNGWICRTRQNYTKFGLGSIKGRLN